MKIFAVPSILAMLAASLAPAQLGARDWGNVGGWYVTSGTNSCGMYSQERGGKGTEVVILKRLDGNIYVQANNLGWNIPRGSEAAARFEVDGQSYSGITNIAALAAYPERGLLAVFDKGFEADLRKGATLAISANGRNIAQISLQGSSAALAAIESCLSEVRSGGGAVAAAQAPANSIAAAGFASLAAIEAKPQGNPGRWIAISDYPRDALRNDREGTTEFRLTVDTNGRVQNCEITVSSGYPDLDEATCKAMERRARFDAAKDSNGQKVQGSFASKVSWKIPR